MRRVLWLVPLGVLGLLAALTAWHGTIPYPDAHYDFADHVHYLAVAAQPFGSRDPLAQEAPYCWRVLAPLVVHVLHQVLGFPLTGAFQVETLLALAGATLGIWWLLGGLRFGGEVRLAGTLAFVLLGPAMTFNLWMPYLVDPLALAIGTWMLALAVHRVWWPLPLLALAGALTKETTLLPLICVVVLAWSTRQRVGLWVAVASLAVALVTLATLHLLIASRGGWTWEVIFDQFWVKPVQSTPLPALLTIPWLVSARLLGGTVGAWLLLLPLALVGALWGTFARRRHVAWIILWAGSLAATLEVFDADREAVFAAAAVIPAACLGLECLVDRWHCSRWAIWAPILIVQAYWSLGYAAWDGLPVITSRGVQLPTLPLFGFLGHERQLLTILSLLLSAGVLGYWLLTHRRRTPQALPVQALS